MARQYTKEFKEDALDICEGKVKIPKAINDIISRTSNEIRIRIVFTKIFRNKVLIGGMTARVSR